MSADHVRRMEKQIGTVPELMALTATFLGRTTHRTVCFRGPPQETALQHLAQAIPATCHLDRLAGQLPMCGTIGASLCVQSRPAVFPAVA